jgi:adenylate cyclase
LRAFLKHIGIGLFCGIAGLLLSFLPPGELLELKGYDLMHYFKGRAFEPPPIVLVGIDEPSFAELNRQWPWPRSIHAQLTTALKKAGAKVIAFDIIFAEPSKREEDYALSSAIKDAGNVILASDITGIANKQYLQQMVIEPLPLFNKHSYSGIVSLSLDRDYAVRRLPPVKKDERLFAEQIAVIYAGRAAVAPANAYISYKWPPGSFERISYYQALEPDKFLPKNFLKNKIVIVGKATTASTEPDKAQVDYFATPFLFAASSNSGIMSGIEIHAYLVSNFLNNTFVIPLNSLWKIFLFIFAGVAGSLLNIRWRPVFSGALTVFAFVGYLALAYIVFEKYMIWIPTIMFAVPIGLPYAVFTVNAYIVSERKKREIKKAFSHYLSPSVLEAVLAHPEKLKLGGEKIEATILFSDIAGFTTLSEKLPPEMIAHIINRHMTVMTKIIIQYKGTVDKFIGDAIMAFWGAPVNDDEHAANACRAAIAMQNQLTLLNEEFKSEGLPEIAMRIGINTGNVIAGNMGSDDLFDYTVLGDAVNLASRLEGANKTFGTSILISRYTFDKAGSNLKTRPLGSITVKGKEEEIEVFELLDVD